MQAFGLFVDDGRLRLGNNAVFKHCIEFAAQGVALFVQLVGERRRKHRRGQRENAYPQQCEDDGHDAPRRGDRRYVAIANRSERDHRPINRLRNIFKFIRLRIVLEQIPKACRKNDQQQHDEHRCAHHRPLAYHHLGQRRRCAGIACQLEQPQ